MEILRSASLVKGAYAHIIVNFVEIGKTLVGSFKFR